MSRGSRTFAQQDRADLLPKDASGDLRARVRRQAGVSSMRSRDAGLVGPDGLTGDSGRRRRGTEGLAPLDLQANLRVRRNAVVLEETASPPQLVTTNYGILVGLLELSIVRGDRRNGRDGERGAGLF